MVPQKEWQWLARQLEPWKESRYLDLAVLLHLVVAPVLLVVAVVLLHQKVVAPVLLVVAAVLLHLKEEVPVQKEVLNEKKFTN